MLLILDGEAAQDAPLPAETAKTLKVFLEHAPGVFQEYQMAATRTGIAEIIDLAYHSSGSEEVTRVLAQLRRARPDAVEEQARQVALGHATLLNLELDGQIRATLELIDNTALAAFEEQLESARINCSLTRAGFLDAGHLEYPPVPDDEARQTLYKDFRATIAKLTIATREFERQLLLSSLTEVQLRSETLPSWTRIYNPARPPTGPVELQRQRYLAVWKAAMDKYPLVAVAGADLVKGALDAAQNENSAPDVQFGDRFDPSKLQELTEGGTPYENALDRTLAQVSADWWRKVVSGGSSLRAEYRKKATETWNSVKAQQWERPEKILGEQHPLWRYPLIIRDALQRLGAIPGALAYSAASYTLEIASAKAAAEARESEERQEILATASMCIGVLGLLPVVGQAAGLVASALTLCVAIPSVLKYRDDMKKFAAFGAYASQHHLAAPDGAGLVLSVLDGATSAMPVLGVAGKLAGKLIRISAVSKRTIGAIHLGTELAINGVAGVTAATMNQDRGR